MKKLPTIIYILIAMMSIGLALADDEMSTKGMRFDSNQMVNGSGIVSSYRYMAPLDLVLESRSSGSGVSISESKIQVRNDKIIEGTPEEFISVGPLENTSNTSITINTSNTSITINTSNTSITSQDMISYELLTENTSVGLLESISSAYDPTELDFPGSFRSEPIRSLWSDSTFAGTHGIVLKASFDRAQALNKEMTTKISGGRSYDAKKGLDTSYSFDGSMKLNAAFNGTGQIGAYYGGQEPKGKMVPDVLMDEYYRGIFTISKKMEIGHKESLTQDEDEWLPCCSGGWDDMNYYDKESFPDDVNRVFNCTCFSMPK